MEARMSQLQQDLADEKLVMESTIRALEKRRGAKEVSRSCFAMLAPKMMMMVMTRCLCMSCGCILRAVHERGGGFVSAGCVEDVGMEMEGARWALMMRMMMMNP